MSNITSPTMEPEEFGDMSRRIAELETQAPLNFVSVGFQTLPVSRESVEVRGIGLVDTARVRRAIEEERNSRGRLEEERNPASVVLDGERFGFTEGGNEFSGQEYFSGHIDRGVEAVSVDDDLSHDAPFVKPLGGVNGCGAPHPTQATPSPEQEPMGYKLGRHGELVTVGLYAAGDEAALNMTPGGARLFADAIAQMADAADEVRP